MKKIIHTLTLILMGTCILVAQSNFHNIHYLDPYNPEYVKGEVLVKFKDEVNVESSFKSGIAKTGISSVDKVLEPYQTEAIVKVFIETREQRSRKSTRTIRDYKGKEIEVPALFNIYKLKFDTIWDEKQIIEELEKDENIEFAEPNYLVYTSEVMDNGIVPVTLPTQTPLPSNTGDRDTYPNDPLYQDGSQWYLDAINAPAAWDSVTGDTTQIIAIIDTGVDWDHPDLDDNIWTNWDEIPDNGIDDDNNGYIDDTRGWDYINNDNDPNDDNSHGTHVAGIAAAEGNNEIGMCGVAWNALIMPVKMLQSSGSGNSSDFAQGIEYASDNGATVINMSLGSYGESQVVKSSLENAYAGTGSGGGSMLVAAAGNDGICICNDCLLCATMFPAGYYFVIGVKASNINNSLAGFSNYDPTGPIEYTHPQKYNYEVMAPGVGIISCKPNGSYWQKNGTSMACPIVAGAVSLMRQNDTTQSGEQIFAKLIQGANSEVLDIYNSLTIELTPDLYYIEYTIVDTLPGCDNDGVADAGETIELYFTIKNAGGQADSVWTKIRFGEFEDTTTAVIADSTSYIGSMSAYSTMTGELDPLIITIDSDVANNRDIVFEYEYGTENSLSFSGTLIITIQKGIEISGIQLGKTVLKPNFEYLITSNTVFDSLIVKPGTTIKMNNGVSISISSYIECDGKPDSLIVFTKNTGYWKEIKNVSNNNFSISYCVFEYSGSYQSIPNSIWQFSLNNCIVRNFLGNTYMFSSGGCTYSMNNVINNHDIYLGQGFSSNSPSTYNVFANNTAREHMVQQGYSIVRLSIPDSVFLDNVFINNPRYNISAGGYWQIYSLPANYWGSIDSSYIESTIADYFEFSNKPVAMGFTNRLIKPSEECHGVVWKIDINSTLINKYDNPYNVPNGLGVVGAETLKFDVYFNRAMDTTHIPLLTFGVREPYTQHIVVDSSTWSADSTIWTAYKTIDMTTGDGIQRVRVASAKDNEYFEIPIEDSRFEFVIQAAAAASIEFYATPGIGKVDLEWPPTPSEDALGYNLYRFYNLTDSTSSDTLMINAELILDTVYTDYNVIPDTTYHYFYKTLGTDMTETDYSKKVTATPFDAANGDANGDLAVNVLDITTIVSYMLNQSPNPFLFDAADVNYDNDINVLDIIGLVQLINGGKSLSIQPLPELSNQTAYYGIKDNVMQFESKGNVAAMQFKIEVRSQETGAKSQEVLENIRIFSLASGFEFAYDVVGDEIIGILYSLSGREIKEGISDLFKFEGVDIHDIEISEIFGCDLSGDYVPVLKKGQQVNPQIPDNFALNVYPNPFYSSTVILYKLAEESRINISIYDLEGRKLANIINKMQEAGSYSVTWSPKSNFKLQTSNSKLNSGIYICHLEAKTENKKITKDVKIILMK